MSHNVSSYDRSNNLRRGGACLACRRRKTRCDGTRPVCNNCVEKNRAEDCEYAEGNQPTPSQVLEENIRLLEERVRQLQAADATGVSLGSASSSSVPANSMSLVNPNSGGNARANGRARSSDSEGSGSSGGEQAWEEELMGEPSFSTAQNLIDAFLPSATSFGFFLDQGRFRASALLTRPAASSNLYGSAYTVPPAGFSDDLNSATLLPLGHPARPTPAVLFSVYLCGLRFTGDERMRREWEGRVLRRALHEVGGASLASSELGLNGTLTESTFATNTTPSNPNTHPLHLLHTIQADILLASYFLEEERYAEADRHVTSAVAIALLGGLHKIRSRSSPASFNTLVLGGTSPSSGASVSASGGLMPSFLLGNSFAGAPQATPEEIEREHVLAFWTALTLDRTVSLPRGLPCAFVTLADRPDRRVDVMWPVEIGAGNEYSIPPSLRTERTIAKFLNHEPTSDGAHFSNASLIAKAALLWDRACELGGMWGIGTNPPPALLAEVRKTSALLDELKARIPPPEVFIGSGSIEDARRRILWASMAHIGTIRLYEGVSGYSGTNQTNAIAIAQADDAMRTKVLTSAVAIFDIVACTSARNLGVLDFVLSDIWLDASHIIAAHLMYLRSLRQPWQEPSEAEGSLMRRFDRGIKAMNLFSGFCPLTANKFAEIRKAYDGLRLQA